MKALLLAGGTDFSPAKGQACEPAKPAPLGYLAATIGRFLSGRVGGGGGGGGEGGGGGGGGGGGMSAAPGHEICAAGETDPEEVAARRCEEVGGWLGASHTHTHIHASILGGRWVRAWMCGCGCGCVRVCVCACTPHTLTCSHLHTHTHTQVAAGRGRQQVIMNIKCTENHALLMTWAGDSWRCDMCATDCAYNPRLRCVACDFDVCRYI